MEKTTKICTCCKTEKNLTEFTFLKSRQKYLSSCRKCENERKSKHKLDNLEYYQNKGKEYREKNKDKIAKDKKDYANKNKEKLAKKNKEYHESNKERIREYKKEYQEINKQKIKEKKKIYYNENKDQVDRKNKNYYLNNKEKIAEYKRQYMAVVENKILAKNVRNKRRAKIKDGSVTPQEIRGLIKNVKSCYWCDKKIDKNNYHLDHFMPLSKGGLHTISNLVIACPTCNLQKNAKDPYKFAQEKGRLL